MKFGFFLNTVGGRILIKSERLGPWDVILMLIYNKHEPLNVISFIIIQLPFSSILSVCYWHDFPYQAFLFSSALCPLRRRLLSFFLSAASTEKGTFKICQQ